MSGALAFGTSSSARIAIVPSSVAAGLAGFVESIVGMASRDWAQALLGYLKEHQSSAISEVPWAPGNGQEGTAAPGVSHANQAALQLLQEWLTDPSDYDETAWATVRELLEADRLSDRRLFGE